MSNAIIQDANLGQPEKRQACPSSAPAAGSATFCGKHADQYEAMKSALRSAAKWSGESGEYAEYDYLNRVPRTSLVCELVDALHRLGYEVRKSPNGKLSRVGESEQGNH